MRFPFRRRKALTATADVVGAIEQGWNAVPLLGGGSRQRIQTIYNTAQSANYSWLYQHSPAVRTVVDLIVRNIGQLDLRLFEATPSSSGSGAIELKPKPDHDAAMSMLYPNQTSTGDMLVRALLKDFLIHDNSYALLNPGVNGRTIVQRVPAFMVEVQGSSLFTAENYRLWPQGAWTGGLWGGSGTYQDVPPENIFHWHGENPLDPRIGYSPLDTLREVIAEDAALQQATVELAQSGLMDRTWVFRPENAPEWSPAARRGFEEELNSRMRRSNKMPLVLEEGMELKPMGISPRNAQMIEVRRWAVTRIAGVYGVPIGLVGVGAPTAEDVSHFYADTLPPYCQSFCSYLDLRLNVQVYDYEAGRFAFDLDEKLMGDARLTALVAASGRSVMLTNEARAKLNLPPINGGDKLVTPMNVQVGDNPKPSPGVMGPQQPGLPAQDGSYRTGQGPTANSNPPTPSPGDATNAAGKAGKMVPLTPLTRPQADRARATRNIELGSSIVERHFKSLQRKLAQTNGHNGHTDWNDLDHRFATDIDRGLRRIARTEGKAQMAKFGGGQFDISPIVQHLQIKAEESAKAINQLLREEVEDLGTEVAFARSEQRVRLAGTNLGATVTRIARVAAVKQCPDADARLETWVADVDCHADLDGTSVPLGADWPGGVYPGRDPGCSCTSTVS